jgi:hypothetical protein
VTRRRILAVSVIVESFDSSLGSVFAWFAWHDFHQVPGMWYLEVGPSACSGKKRILENNAVGEVLFQFDRYRFDAGRLPYFDSSATLLFKQRDFKLCHPQYTSADTRKYRSSLGATRQAQRKAIN